MENKNNLEDFVCVRYVPEYEAQTISDFNRWFSDAPRPEKMAFFEISMNCGVFYHDAEIGNLGWGETIIDSFSLNSYGIEEFDSNFSLSEVEDFIIGEIENEFLENN